MKRRMPCAPETVEGDYVMFAHPLTYRRLFWKCKLKEGRYSYVWKAMEGQTLADWQGYGING